MILEQETFEAFGYFPSGLSLKSNKTILAACENCGKNRTTTKGSYRLLCNKCAHKNDLSGREHPLFKEKIKRSCGFCGKGFEVPEWRIKRGEGIYCCSNCYWEDMCGKTLSEGHKANIRATLTGRTLSLIHKENLKGRLGVKNPLFKGGRLMTYKRHSAKRRRQLGYTLLMPLEDGEVGHHVTDEYVIGISKDVHKKLSGYKRKKHRELALEWLKDNDKKKYEIVVSALATTLIRSTNN